MCYNQGMETTNGYFALRWAALSRDNFTCQYCGQHAPNVILHADHIIPVAAGGKDTLDNLVACCSACNIGKGSTLSIPKRNLSLPLHIPTIELIKDFIAERGPSGATNIAKGIKRNRPNVSATLAHNKAFVKAGRRGKDVLYALNPQAL